MLYAFDEVKNGVYNVAQNCLHPLETINGILNNLGLAWNPWVIQSARYKTEDNIYNHPIRTSVEVVGTVAVVAKGLPLAWQYAKEIDRDTANKMAVGGLGLAVGAYVYNSMRRNSVHS